MTTIQRDQREERFPIIGLVAVALALIAAGTYILIDLDLLAIGDVKADEARSGIIYVAAASYLIGGLLILLRNRWLWVVGAIMNAFVIVFFLQLYRDRPDVMLSPGGFITKVSQFLLEVILLYLIVADWLRSRRA
jgi:hypothetical protein